MKRRINYQPPFPYFGGSSPVASPIWEGIGYGLQNDDEEGVGRANRKRERLWFSPHCLQPRQGGLFA